MNKNILYLLLLISLIAIAFCSCNRTNKAKHHMRKLPKSKEAIKVTEKNEFDFTTLDTANYYMGEMDDSTYIFKIDHISQTGFTGRYYSVNEQPVMDAIPFEVSQKDGDYTFLSEGKRTTLKFDLILDTASVHGTISTTFKKKDLAFEKYHDPDFTEYNSPRYAVSCPTDYLDIEVVKDIVYGKAKGYWTSKDIEGQKIFKVIMRGISQTAASKELDLMLDLYLPKDSTVKKRPLFVLLHGGAFYFGDKGAETMSTWCEHFAHSGYVVASINYRMGFNISKHSIQKCGYEAMQDAHAAIRFLVANADKYGIDPEYIFVGGTSAGAITTLGMAYMNNGKTPDFIKESKLDRKLGSIESSGNKHHNKFKIKALANMWGAVYDLSQLDGHHIPVISFHGTADDIVPYDQGYPFSRIRGGLDEMLFDPMYGSKAIHERLDSLHVRNEFHPIPDVGHAPYQDKNGHPNDCYFFIQNKMQRFFYTELTHVKRLVHDPNDPQIYYCSQDDITTVNWKVSGGFILESKDKRVRVLWRKDAREHKVTASGLRENGMAFTISI